MVEGWYCRGMVEEVEGGRGVAIKSSPMPMHMIIIEIKDIMCIFEKLSWIRVTHGD